MLGDRHAASRRLGAEAVLILAGFLLLAGCNDVTREGGGGRGENRGAAEQAFVEAVRAPETKVVRKEPGSAETVAGKTMAAPHDMPRSQMPEWQRHGSDVVAPGEAAGSAAPVAGRATATSRDELAGKTQALQGKEGRTPAPEPKTAPAEPVVLTDASFRELTNEGVVLAYFWAPWCPWCRRLAPIIDKLAAEYAGKAVVAKLNTDENPETPARYAVRGLPTVIVLRDGEPVAKLEGFRPEEYLRRALDAALGGE
jgi:thioredoxin 1